MLINPKKDQVRYDNKYAINKNFLVVNLYFLLEKKTIRVPNKFPFKEELLELAEKQKPTVLLINYYLLTFQIKIFFKFSKLKKKSA